MSDSGNRLLRYLRRLGAGSLLISIIIHVVVIIVATMFVVSSVREERKTNFKGGSGTTASGPPDVQHRVQMSHHQPNLSAVNQRLVVDSPNAVISLPDLPDMPGSSGGAGKLGTGSGIGSGNGVGAGGGAGPSMPAFGFREAQSGGSLVGRFYDFKQLANATPNPDLARFGPGPLAEKEISGFTQGTWNAITLSKFYRAPDPLYATQIFMPNMLADEAPKAYGVEKKVQARSWICHYRGRISPPSTGSFRFVGGADDFMVVRIDGRVVLDAGLFTVSKFKSDLPQPRSYPYEFPAPGNNLQKSRRGGFVVGQRMELRAGLFYDIDIIIGEGLGGHFYSFLYFEQDGVDYAKDGRGNPVLPIFRVADAASPDRRTAIPPYMENGSVWRALPVR